MNNNNPNNPMEKSLNFQCVCGRTYNKNIKLVMLLPCEHIFHKICIKTQKYIFCPLCDTEIEGNFKLTDKINTDMDAQRYADMLSVSHYCTLSDYDTSSVIDNALSIGNVLISIPVCSGIKQSRDISTKFLSLNNTEVNVRGLDRFNSRDKKVFIANHTSYMDFIIISRFIDTYFLASSFIKESAFGRMLLNIMPIMVFKRGTSNNTVDQMKEFVEKNRSICLFPEGAMCHPDTIVRFRTGAFYIGEPVYPIVLRYENIKSDFNIATFFMKSSSRDRVKIYLDVLGPYYPPFTQESIERIRSDMANVGNMLLSRVSTRDISDN